MTDFQRPLWVYPILVGFLVLVAAMLWPLVGLMAGELTQTAARIFAS